MATTTPETLVTETKAATSWLLLHERLIITLVLIAVSVFGVNKLLDHEYAKDKTASDAAALVLSNQQVENKALAAQVATTQQQYQQLTVQLSQQNAQIAQAMQSRTVVLQQQQATDQTIPMPDLGNRWLTLTGIKPSEMTATTQGVTVTPDAARTTVEQLESVPVLTADVASEKTENDNLSKELGSANDLSSDLTLQVAGLNTTLVDQTKACTTEEATLKAQARRSKLHWFGAGFGTGFVSGLVVGHLK